MIVSIARMVTAYKLTGNGNSVIVIEKKPQVKFDYVKRTLISSKIMI